MPFVRTTSIVCNPLWESEVGLKERRELPDFGRFEEPMTCKIETVLPSASGVINPEIS